MRQFIISSLMIINFIRMHLFTLTVCYHTVHKWCLLPGFRCTEWTVDTILLLFLHPDCIIQPRERGYCCALLAELQIQSELTFASSGYNSDSEAVACNDSFKCKISSCPANHVSSVLVSRMMPWYIYNVDQLLYTIAFFLAEMMIMKPDWGVKLKHLFGDSPQNQLSTSRTNGRSLEINMLIRTWLDSCFLSQCGWDAGNGRLGLSLGFVDGIDRSGLLYTERWLSVRPLVCW